jgi:DNA-binding CsgD family transcriptional regulator/predicted ester cyclase
MSEHPLPDGSLPVDYKSLVRRWTTELWNHRREAVIDEMMSPDCRVQVEGVDGELNLEDFKAYRRTFLQAVPDLFVEILSITTEGETSMQCWRATGTHTGYGLGIPPSGRRVDFTGASYYEFKDGRIVCGFDRWNRGEMIASLMQVRMDELCERTLLTRREAQVALLMAERFAHTEIADQLKIRPNTARRHCERVLEKLGVRKRQDVAQALGKIPGSVLDRHASDIPVPGERRGAPPPS